MSETAPEFTDIQTAVGQSVKWEYRRILRPEIVLLDNHGRQLMVMRKRHLFSMKHAKVHWLGASCCIEMHLTGPFWMTFVPFFGRTIRDDYRLTDDRGTTLASTGESTHESIAVHVGTSTLHYRRINSGWRHLLVLDSDLGEIASGPRGRPEFQILRQIDQLPESLAVYWQLRLLDWDGYEG